MDALEILETNLDALNTSAAKADQAQRSMRAFYHRVCLKCAARMTVEDFAWAIEAAQQKPVGAEPEPDIERDRR
jgi:hypothetical protein